MSILELLVLAVGLSMDVFAIAVCKGLAMKDATVKNCCIIGGWFGVTQAVMPFLGFILGQSFAVYIARFDHWIAFIVLGIIGILMIKESYGKDSDSAAASASISYKIMLPMAVATSVDALTVGITFSFLNVNIVSAVCIIGIITFLLGFTGTKVGRVFGTRLKSKAELCGGIILILLGTKILLEHLEIINF